MTASDELIPGGPHLRIARVYDVLDEPAEPGEMRVLVDRLWPRGVRKDRLEIAEWDKDACPSTELRQDLHGGALDPEEFAVRYRAELDRSGAAAALLERARSAQVLTLLVAARDLAGSHVHVLARALEDAAA